jgi:hypothetical protein
MFYTCLMSYPSPLDIRRVEDSAPSPPGFRVLAGRRAGPPGSTYAGRVAISAKVTRTAVLRAIVDGELPARRHSRWPGVWVIRRDDAATFVARRRTPVSAVVAPKLGRQR